MIVMDHDPVIEQLDRAVRPSDVSDRIAATLERVMTKLESGNGVMAWDTIPLAVFGNTLPSSIGSCWIFVIRADAGSTAERHPNSHQRSLSLVGEGEFQLRPSGRWERHRLTSAVDEPPERRWVSIPANTWHRVAAGRKPWGMVSFHTAPSADLIEEKPVDPDRVDTGPTERRRYADST
jgi:hypothetical protein